MSQTLRFSNFLKNSDAVLILRSRAIQEPIVMKRKDNLNFVLEFLKAYGIDDEIVRKVERNAKEKWKKFDEHFREAKYWEEVRSFSEF